MIIFNNALDAALQYVCSWDKKNFLTEVTLIRDVFGKISFLRRIRSRLRILIKRI